ncbi:MAG: hypothetical protein AB7F75_10885 [Planctomycetota bacterium]
MSADFKVETSYTINGRTYGSLEEVPENLRPLIQGALQQAGLGAPKVSAAYKALAFLLSGSVPFAVGYLAHRPTESPFGHSFEMLVVMIVGFFLALSQAWKGWKVRSPFLYFCALLAVSPVLYFVLWNLFFRKN